MFQRKVQMNNQGKKPTHTVYLKHNEIFALEHMQHLLLHIFNFSHSNFLTDCSITNPSIRQMLDSFLSIFIRLKLLRGESVACFEILAALENISSVITSLYPSS